MYNMFDDDELDGRYVHKPHENFELDLSGNDSFEVTSSDIKSKKRAGAGGGGFAGNQYSQNVGRTSGAKSRPLPRENVKSKADYSGLIKIVLAFIIVYFVADFVMGMAGNKVALDSMVNMNTEEMEDALDLDFAKDCTMKSKIHHYSEGTITVDGDGSIGVVYIDGKQVGIHTDSSKYSLFGVEIGQTDKDLQDNMTFQYDDYFFMLENEVSSNSTTWFYANTKTNTCMVIICSDMTGRVVAMAYYGDYRKMTEKVSHW